MLKQYYHADSYTTQSSVGYLVKRAHGMNLDAVEPELAQARPDLHPVTPS